MFKKYFRLTKFTLGRMVKWRDTLSKSDKQTIDEKEA